jgi:hypothetical protein
MNAARATIAEPATIASGTALLLVRLGRSNGARLSSRLNAPVWLAMASISSGPRAWPLPLPLL